MTAPPIPPEPALDQDWKTWADWVHYWVNALATGAVTLSVTLDGLPTGSWGGVIYQNSDGVTWATNPRPSTRGDLTFLWVGTAGTFPASVSSGVTGPRIGVDILLPL